MSRLGFACLLLMAGLGDGQTPVIEPPTPRHPEGVPATVTPVEGERLGGSLLFDGSVFAWAPRRRGQEYAIVGTNPNFAPIGTIRTIEGDYDMGFRVAGGYRMPGESGFEILGAYTYWRSAANDSIAATPGGVLFATLTHPSAVVQVRGAAGENSVNMNVFDVELARRIELGDCTHARLFFGPRFANLDQHFCALYTGGDVASSTVQRKLTFDGGGLRAGGEATFDLFQHFGLFVRGSAGMMTGRMRSGLSEVSNGQAIVNVNETFNKVIPMTDLGIGLSYQSGGMRISVGYEFHTWFGAVEGFDFVDDVHAGKMARKASDLGFDGIFARFEWAF